MSLRDLLDPYFPDPATFRLPVPNNLGSPDIDKVIGDYLPAKTFEVTAVKNLAGQDPVTFCGKALLARPQTDKVDVDVTFATVAGVPQFSVVSGTLPATWRFETAFPELTGTAIAAIAFTDARLALASSSAVPPGGLRIGLGFDGTPDETGPLDPVAWLFPWMPKIGGAIALSGDWPLMELKGAIPQGQNLGFLTLVPGVRLSTIPPLPRAGTAVGGNGAADAVAEAVADLSIGQGSGAVPTSVVTQLSATPGPLTQFSLGQAVGIDTYSQLNALSNNTADFSALALAVPGSAKLSLDGLTLIVAPEEVELTAILARVSLAPETSWPLLPEGVLSAKRLAVTFAVNRPMERPSVTATVAGRFEMEVGKPTPVTYDVVVSLPDLTVQGQLAPWPGNTIPLDKLLANLLGPFVPVVDIPKLEVYQLDIGVDVPNAAFSFAAGIDANWELLKISDTFAIRLIGINVTVVYAESQVGLMVDGEWRFEFNPKDPTAWLQFDATAMKAPGETGWQFELEQAPGPGLDVVAVVRHFIGEDVTVPSNIKVQIQDVAVGLNTGTLDYSVAGRVVVAWKLEFVPGQVLEVEAHLAIESTTAPRALVAGPGALPPPYAIVRPAANGLPARTTSGTFGGSVKIWEFKAAVEYQFGSDKDVLQFSFEFRKVVVWCTRTVEKIDNEDQVIVRGGLRGVSLGDILEFLVSLVDPDSEFRLSPPWDVLYQLTFDKLTVELNLTKDTVGFSYAADLDLGFMSVKSVGMTYGRNEAGQTTVFMNLEGSFMGQDFGGKDPLSWDVMNESPPAPSGKGDQLLDLRYLGVGQNVGFRDGRRFESVLDVINALQADFDPAPGGDDNPLDPRNAPALAFTGDGRWLIGADFTVIGAVKLTGVFADPVLYGVRIGLSGEKVKSFKGLQFEIFYKKVTDTIGVYQTELTLPDAFRQLQFGAVSLTFPIVGIDVYTNGNFRVDFGFPRGRDFTRSFCIQAGPFIGYGGFYLAVLNGETSERVPRIANGNFSPVIEAGIGLSVGVGRTLDKGVLKAGVTVTVEAIIEGALAWFNPHDRSLPSEVFYHVEGTAAIIGKLYGSIDFVVIKANVSVTAQASVTLVAESYKAIQITLSLGVDVAVSIEVLFIKIDFSFATSIDLSFEIGQPSTPPWQLAAPDPAADPLLLRQQRSQHRNGRVPPALVRGALLAAAGGVQIVPTPKPVFSSTRDVAIQLVPAFTVAGKPTTVQTVVMLFVDTGANPALRGPRRDRPAPDAASIDAPFNLLARGLLRWALSWVGETTTVHVERLDEVRRWLEVDDNRRQAFAWSNLTSFIGANYVLRVTAPQLTGDAASFPSPIAAAAFPIVPVMGMTPQGRSIVPFWATACVDRDWEDRLATYYDQTQLDPADGTAAPPRTRTPTSLAPDFSAGCTMGSEPLSSLIFSDWFAMLAKGAVQAARDMLDAYPFKVTKQESLNQVLAAFPSQAIEHEVGDHQTLATVAARYGIAPGELRRANPDLTVAHPDERLAVGTTLSVPGGPTLATLAEANADYPFRIASPAARVPLAGVKHQVIAPSGTTGKTQSIAQVASEYGPYGAPGPTGLFGDSGAPGANSANNELLQPGVSMKVPSHGYVVTAGDMLGNNPLARLAARTWVRTGGGMTGHYSPWYSQRIADLNKSLTGPIPIGTQVTVPLAVAGPSGIKETGVTQYSAIEGDTIERVADYFELIQIEAPANKPYSDFAGKITYSGPIKQGTKLGLPQVPYIVRPGDSVKSIAAKLEVDPLQLVGANAATDGLLRPLGVMAMPPLHYPPAKGDTLQSVATKFDLTLSELAEGASGATGLLAPFGATANYRAPVGAVTVPHVTSRDRDKLEADLLDFNRFGELSGAVSRFLLHGMRVPPPSSTGPNPTLQPLHETVGQQFPAPQPTQPYDIAFSRGLNVPWFCYGGSPPACPTGMNVRLGATFMRQSWPSTTFDPQIKTGPEPVPFARAVAPHYGMPRGMHWQAGSPVPLPGPTGDAAVAGQPSVWMFPGSLLAELARDDSPSGPWQLVTAPADAAIGTEDKPVDHFMWATAVPVRVSRVPAPSGDPVGGGYLLGGADQAGRDLLLGAWVFMKKRPDPRDEVQILYPPSRTIRNSGGLASAPLERQRTFVLRTNLSTITHSNVAEAAKGDSGTDWARNADPGRFLELVWQASVTGSGGFYLAYSDEAGNALPDDLFAEGPEATIWLLILLKVQRADDPAGRMLLPFNNCAVVGANIDASAATLFARLDQPTPQQLTAVPTLPAGTLGFRLERIDPGRATKGEPLTRSLYNLLGYQVPRTADFADSHEGLAVGPIETTGDEDDWPAVAPGAALPWRYQQLVPISGFGRVNDTPSCSALPPRGGNPYAGITGPTAGGGRALSKARLDLAFQDVYGNRAPAVPPLPSLDVPVGYIDDVIAVGAWPGAGFAYELRPATGVELAAALSLQSDRYVAGGGLSFAQSHEAARNDAARYERIYYQVQQRDLTPSFKSNIGTAGIAADELKAPLSWFVIKAKLLADACAALSERKASVTAGKTLDAVGTEWAVTPGQLLARNGDLPAKSVFSGDVVIPRLVAAAPGNTLDQLAREAAATPWPPTCPKSNPVGQATPVEVAGRNAARPLGPGIVLRTNARATTTPASWNDPTSGNVPNTVAGVAAWLATTPYAAVINPDDPTGPSLEIGLVADNLTATGLIADGLTITVGDVIVTTDGTTTFASLRTAFQSVLPDLASFANGIAGDEGIFRSSAPITRSSFVVPQPPEPAGAGPAVPAFALRDMPADTGSQSDLATWNRAVPTFYAPGTPVYLDYRCVTPAAGDALESLAAANRLALDDLGAFNGRTALAAVELTVPLLTRLELGTTRYTAHAPRASESLSAVAALYSSAALAVADLNRYLHGPLNPRAVIRIAGGNYTPLPLESLNELWTRVSKQVPSLLWDQFVSQLAPQTGVLRENGAIVVSLPRVPNGTSPRNAAKRFGVQPSGVDDLAAVTVLFTLNRTLEGFLASGRTIKTPGGASLTLGASDTIETVIRRFRDEQRIDVTVAQLAAANADDTALLGTGAAMLLPAPPTAITSTFTPTIPPPGAKGEESVIFPVTVEVRLARSQYLVNPELAKVPGVREVSSRLTPLGMTDPEGLRRFATQFEQALASSRLKCAVSKPHGLEADGTRGEIWAVWFGTGGINKLSVDSGEPSFHALAPLSTSLRSGDIDYYPYATGCGLKDKTSKRFESVDVDAWLRSMLEAIDLYLSTPYSVPSFQQGGPSGLPWGELRGVPGVSGCKGCTGPTGPPSGPADFERVVRAKERIAGELRNRVQPVLTGVGATGSRLAARETMYEQMLQRLSSAYEIDSVVEWPVSVQSPWARGASGQAPRVSGQVVPNLLTSDVTSSDGLATIDELAKAAGVSAAYLAQIASDRPGLLAIGQPVTWGSGRHVIAADDTIASVATALGVQVDLANPADWRTWVSFVEGAGGIGKQRILPAAAGLPVTAISRAVGPGDSLGAIARFAGSDVASIGRANQNVAGIFVAGRVIQVDEQSHTVRANQTIYGIAGEMQVTVDALSEAPSVRDATNLLAAPKLWFATLLPDSTLSTAKVPAGPVGGDKPDLSVLVTLGDRARERNVFFDLTYFVNELEYGIRPVSGVSGYEASSWLSFPIPIGAPGSAAVGIDTTVPQVQVPVPLRSYPETPLLATQIGMPTYPGATTIDKAKRWSYAFDFERRAAAQDTTHLEVTFEHGSSLVPAARAADALLSPLATFSEAWPALSADLAKLTSLPPGVTSTDGAIAAQVLSCLATWVAQALAQGPVEDVAAGDDRTYRYEMDTRGSGGELTELSLVRGPPGPPGPLWPSSLWVRSTTGYTGGSAPNEGFLPLTPNGTAGATAQYLYPTGVPAGVPLRHRMRFDNRDVTTDDRGYGGIRLTRNRKLIDYGPLGTDNTVRPYFTNPAFVYQTPLVQFIDPLVPTLETDAAINIAALSNKQQRLKPHLTALLNSVFGAASGWVQLTCGYAYPAAGPGADLWVTQPIRFLPRTAVAPGDPNGIALSMANSVFDWRKRQEAVRPDARLFFELTALTPAAAGSTEYKPILNLPRLLLEFRDIDWTGPAEEEPK